MIDAQTHRTSLTGGDVIEVLMKSSVQKRLKHLLNFLPASKFPPIRDRATLVPVVFEAGEDIVVFTRDCSTKGLAKAEGRIKRRRNAKIVREKAWKWLKANEIDRDFVSLVVRQEPVMANYARSGQWWATASFNPRRGHTASLLVPALEDTFWDEAKKKAGISP